MGSAGARGDQQREKEMEQNESDDDSGQGYSDKDGIRLMELVQQYELHAFVRGKKLWQVLAKFQVIEDRTWQGLKGYFLQTVLKNVGRFGGNKEDTAKFNSASEETRRTNKRHFIPRETLDKLRQTLKHRRDNMPPLILIDD